MSELAADGLIEDRANVPKWVDYALLFTLFINVITLFQSPFEFYLGYVFIIILLQKYLRVYKFPRALLGIYLMLLITGLLSVYSNQNEMGQFIKIFMGSLIAYLFYYYLMQRYKWDVKYLFKLYLKGVWIATLIGLVQFLSFLIDFSPGYDFKFLFNKWGLAPGGLFGLRVNGVFGEPTYYATFMVGGAFVALNNLTGPSYYYSKAKSLVILIVYFLTFSGNATIGLFLALLLIVINKGLLKYSLFLLPLGYLAFIYNYEKNFEFQHRFDSSMEVLQTENFEIGSTHGSSIILYNNYHVAMQSFKENPLFGGGLGSHSTSFAKYSLTKNIGIEGFDWNSQDANSMLLRLISETGLFGVLIFLGVIFRFYIRKKTQDNTYWIISNAMLVVILLNLVRQGHYFLHGFPFFMWMYYYVFLKKKESASKRELEV